MRKIKTYYIEAHSGWFLTKCWTLRQARAQASIEYGRTVKIVRLATDDEIKHFLALKGENALN
jgi:hypothetical protein